MDSRILFQNKLFEVNGMESDGRRELGNPPLTDMRYSSTLDNVEEIEGTRYARTSNYVRNCQHAKSRQLRNGRLRLQLTSNKSIKENGD